MAAVQSLDLAYGGLVYATLAHDVTLNNGLDLADGGLPFWAEELTALAAGQNTITVSSEEQQIYPLNRRYPLKRFEFVGETQIRHIEPKFGTQYSSYLP